MFLYWFVFHFSENALSKKNSNVEYKNEKLWNYHITLESYKKTARSPATVLPTCVYTCVHVVNCTAKSYANNNTWSRTCALIPLHSRCDFYVNWEDFSMLGKQQAWVLQIYSTVVTYLELNIRWAISINYVQTMQNNLNKS